jgi:hypothetical protein
MAAPREITKLAIATSAADPSDIGFIKDTFQPVQLNLKQRQLTTWVGKISFPMLPEHSKTRIALDVRFARLLLCSLCSELPTYYCEPPRTQPFSDVRV